MANIIILKFSDFIYFVEGLSMTEFNALETKHKDKIVLRHKRYVKRVNDLLKK